MLFCVDLRIPQTELLHYDKMDSFHYTYYIV